MACQVDPFLSFSGRDHVAGNGVWEAGLASFLTFEHMLIVLSWPVPSLLLNSVLAVDDQKGSVHIPPLSQTGVTPKIWVFS